MLISVPPQHGKTELAVRRFIPFLFGKNPNEKIIFYTYSLHKAYAESRQIQGIMAGNDYKILFPFIDIEKKGNRERQDITTVSRFNLKNFDGYFIAGSLNAGTAGETATTIVIDDPYRNRQEGMNIRFLNELYENYLANIRTREGIYRAEKLKQVIIHTRWHEEDLIGKLIKNDTGWRYIKIPAIKTNEINDYDFREVGEPIWRDKIPLDKINDLKQLYGDIIFNSLYQQEPIRLEGNYFTYENMRFYNDNEIELENKVMMVDLAISQKQTADYTAVCIAGEVEDTIYIERVYRKRVRGNEILNFLNEIYEKHKPRIIGVERTNYQLAIIHQLQAMGLPTIELKPVGDKVQRTEPTVAMLEGGKLFFSYTLKNNIEFIREMMEFPNSIHDDQVDVLNYAVEYFIKQKRKKLNIRLF